MQASMVFSYFHIIYAHIIWIHRNEQNQFQFVLQTALIVALFDQRLKFLIIVLLKVLILISLNSCRAFGHLVPVSPHHRWSDVFATKWMKFKFDIEKHFQNSFLARIISSRLIKDKNIQRLKGSELNKENWKLAEIENFEA